MIIKKDISRMVRYDSLHFGDTFTENDKFYIKTKLKNEEASYAAVNLLTGDVVDFFIDCDLVYPINIKGVIEYDD